MKALFWVIATPLVIIAASFAVKYNIPLKWVSGLSLSSGAYRFTPTHWERWAVRYLASAQRNGPAQMGELA